MKILFQANEIKPKKGRNKISKTQKADITKNAVYELLNEDENEASRNASYTPVVGFFLLSCPFCAFLLFTSINYKKYFCVFFMQGNGE